MSKAPFYFVYVLTNEDQSLFYSGVTDNLKRRWQEHRQGKIFGFSKHLGLDRMVYFEAMRGVQMATGRERRIHRWGDDFKLRYFRRVNPDWQDLYACDVLPDSGKAFA